MQSLSSGEPFAQSTSHYEDWMLKMTTCEMNILTSQEFNCAIDQFKDFLLDNLQSTVRFKVVVAEVKQVNEERYMFASSTIGQDDTRLEFTISYDKFYQVPIFSFRFYINDKLDFNIDELDQSLKESSNLVLNRLVDLSIIDHHLLHQPWFQIHPCETLNTLNTHVQSQRTITSGQNYNYKYSISYLSCWFGLYALPEIFPQFSIRPVIYS
ncbi:hypothetical protein CANMA_003286 [Candida margitis]|uniref:uncharacterized protein n=1 Tax=Candida margitis TaxID=1775924 RepID=UPI002227DC41|nr:uncharacterized protein CANMA_003286 [Candida margitis]KAI5966040.1 hypothetical protein CANMA_003286 [Candida margitis]